MKSIYSICLTFAVIVVIGLSVQPVPAHAQNIISTIAGGGPTPATATAADLPGPTAAVRDSLGNTYIASPLSTNLFELTTGGTFSVIAGQGYGGYNGEGILASLAQLGNPAAIAIDPNGNIFFADPGSSRVRRIDATTGLITTVAGNGVKCDHGYNPCGDGGSATAPPPLPILNLPEAIALDSAGNLYIADSNDNRIREVANATTCWSNQSCIITTVVGTVNPPTITTSNQCPNPGSSCGDGGAATSALLNFPEGVTVDASGNIYVSDTLDMRVRIVSGGTINAFAGTGGYCRNSTQTCGDGHPATSAQLYKPQGLAVDASGNIYIADTADHKIRYVDTTGFIWLFAGLGVQGFAGDGSSALNATLDLPVGVSVDGSGNVLVADSGNQRVRIITGGVGGVISTLAGSGTGGDGGPATSALLAGNYGVSEDSNGNLYIADTGNNRLRMVSGGTISTIAGTGSVGYTGDGGPATSATFNYFTHAVVDAQGNIFIADTGNLVVREIVKATGNISTIAGNGTTCNPTTSGCGDTGLAINANISWPLGIALDATNSNLYIADYFANRIRKVNLSTGIITTVAGTGNQGSKGDGGPATKAYLNHPSSVALDGNGDLFISDQYNFRVQEVVDGTMTTIMGDGKACLCGDGGPASKGSMWNPLEIDTDPAGNIFVGGGNDNVVQRINGTTNIWGTVAGNAAAPLTGGFTGDGGPATLATLSNFGVWIDGNNNLYIGDEGNNRVRTVHLTPAVTLPTQPLNFGNVAMGTNSPSKAVKLTSSGGIDLNLTNISITGANASNFSQTNTCGSLPALLGVDQVCTTNVVFTPSFYGTAKATLTFTDSATGSPQAVSLSGSGPDFSISNSPTSITVAPGTNGFVTTTLKPIAAFNQTITLSCLGAPAGTTCTPNPSQVTLNGTSNGTSTIQVSVGSTTPAGTYTLTVKGAYVPLQHPAKFTLIVP